MSIITIVYVPKGIADLLGWARQLMAITINDMKDMSTEEIATEYTRMRIKDMKKVEVDKIKIKLK